MWEGMQTGTCDMAVMTNAYVSSYVPANGALDLPFIFSDLEQARGIVDGEFGQALIDNLEGTGVTCLAFSEGGFRQLCTRSTACLLYTSRCFLCKRTGTGYGYVLQTP